MTLSIEQIWRKYDAVESRLTAGLSERMVELANLQPGMRVLDLATGRGEPALRLARAVGPAGSVLGTDPSDAVLQLAREKATSLGLTNLELRALGAEALEDVESQSFDAATARWGLEYMPSPVVALSHACRALKPGGRLVAAMWAEAERVPYRALPERLLALHHSPPSFDPEAPGAFRYGDPERIVRDFSLAGFVVDHREEVEVDVIETETARELVHWVCEALGFARLLDGLAVAAREAWERDLVREAESLRRDGRFRLGGVSRIVVATAGRQQPTR